MAKTETTTSITATPNLDAFKSAGHNVKYMVLNDILFIAVPISAKTIEASRPSASGKNKTVGSTLGNITVEGAGGVVKMGVNVYAPI